MKHKSLSAIGTIIKLLGLIVFVGGIILSALTGLRNPGTIFIPMFAAGTVGILLFTFGGIVQAVADIEHNTARIASALEQRNKPLKELGR